MLRRRRRFEQSENNLFQKLADTIRRIPDVDVGNWAAARRWNGPQMK